MIYYFVVIIIMLVIWICVNTFRKAKTSKAYIIERRKSFYKIVEQGYVVTNPFIDKIKCVVDLTPQITETMPISVYFADSVNMEMTIKISFEVINVQKIAYLEQNIEDLMEEVAGNILFNIIKKIKYCDYKCYYNRIENYIQTNLNNQFYNLGCKIDKVEISLNTDSNLDKKQKKLYVVNHNVNKRVRFTNYYIAICFFSMALVLSEFVYKLNINNMLLICLIRQICEGTKVIIPCFFLSKVVLTSFKELNKNKYITELIIGFTIIFIISVDLINQPSRVKISDERTTTFSYKCALFLDYIAPQTTTVKVSNVTTKKSYSKSVKTGKKKTRYYYPASIAFNLYESEVPENLVELVDKLKILEDEITIEYYNNSKTIKAIDGIDIFDYKGIQKRISILEQQNPEKNIKTPRDYLNDSLY